MLLLVLHTLVMCFKTNIYIICIVYQLLKLFLLTLAVPLYGAEVISAVVSVLLIYILTSVLVYEAIQRTIHQDFSIDGDVMLITAAVGVAVNLM